MGIVWGGGGREISLEPRYIVEKLVEEWPPHELIMAALALLLLRSYMTDDSTTPPTGRVHLKFSTKLLKCNEVQECVVYSDWDMKDN